MLEMRYDENIFQRFCYDSLHADIRNYFFRQLIALCVIFIGVREGILLGRRKKFALKITICPESNFFGLIRMGLKPLVNLFYTVEFVYNGFVCNVNSPITLHFVRSRWHLSHAFQFACNVISAITFFTQSPRGALTGKLCSYLAC